MCGRDPSADLAATVRRWPDLSPALLDVLTTMSVLDPTYPGVLAAVASFATGDDAAVRTLVSTWRQRSAIDAASLSQGLHASTLCVDLDFPWGGADTDPAGRAAAVDASVATEAKANRLAPFDEEATGGNGFIATCRAWPRTSDEWSASNARDELPALAKSGPRTLILAGDRDLSTPLVWSRAAAAALPGSRLVVVAGAGHSVQSRGPASAGAEASRFLLEP